VLVLVVELVLGGLLGCLRGRRWAEVRLFVWAEFLRVFETFSLSSWSEIFFVLLLATAFKGARGCCSCCANCSAESQIAAILCRLLQKHKLLSNEPSTSTIFNSCHTTEEDTPVLRSVGAASGSCDGAGAAWVAAYLALELDCPRRDCASADRGALWRDRELEAAPAHLATLDDTADPAACLNADAATAWSLAEPELRIPLLASVLAALIRPAASCILEPILTKL
jgi:hypothetical protein